MDLFNLTYVDKEDEVVNMSLSKDEDGNLWLSMFEGINNMIEVKLSKRTLLDMFMNAELVGNGLTKEETIQVFSDRGGKNNE